MSLISKWTENKAQTVTELAIFGSILLFIVGVIVRQALSYGHVQNQNLRAVRMALKMSYEHSGGFKRGFIDNDRNYGNSSRNFANIMIVEDRLSAESAKYGALTRNPITASAQAAHSRNLFMPIDAGEDYNLPIFDMLINGKHIPLTTASFKTVCFMQNAADCTNAGITYDKWLGQPNPLIPPDPSFWEPRCVNQDGGPEFVLVYPCTADGAQAAADTVALLNGGSTTYDAASTINAGSYNPPQACLGYPDPPGSIGLSAVGCREYYVTAIGLDPANGWEATMRCDANCTDSAGCLVPAGGIVGCARLYAISVNNPQNPSWCTGTCSCPANNCPASSTPLLVDQRFDLDRNGTTDVPASIHPDFEWQWTLVSAVDEDYILRRADNVTLLRGEFLSFGQEEDSDQKNIILDVDNDLKEERLVRETLRHNSVGVVLAATVIDSQDGDIDFTYNTKNYHDYQARALGSKPEPGLLNDVAMFTRTSPGTYLEIQEGRLYGPNQQFIRNIQRKDHIDVIQRIVQLSNDTGRFCLNGVVNNDPNIWSDYRNPVEACGTNCFTGANIALTCFDTDDLRLFVRSRVQDSFGHQWITETTGDGYVEFAPQPLIPPVP